MSKRIPRSVCVFIALPLLLQLLPQPVARAKIQRAAALSLTPHLCAISANEYPCARSQSTSPAAARLQQFLCPRGQRPGVHLRFKRRRAGPPSSTYRAKSSSPESTCRLRRSPSIQTCRAMLNSQVRTHAPFRKPLSPVSARRNVSLSRSSARAASRVRLHR